MDLKCLIFLSLPVLVFAALFSKSDLDDLDRDLRYKLNVNFRDFAQNMLEPHRIRKLVDQITQSQDLNNVEVKFKVQTLQQILTTKLETVLNSLEKVKTSLKTYLHNPITKVSGPPILYKECCAPFSPSNLRFEPKLGQLVSTKCICYTRNRQSKGQGFNLYDTKTLELIKKNFKIIPSMLWQELATQEGLHVQYPATSMNCKGTDSTSKLLRKWYQPKLKHAPLRLVVVIDASQATSAQVPISKVVHIDIIKSAVQQLLTTLLPQDLVHVVAVTQNNISMPSKCFDRLLSPNTDNLKTLSDFLLLLTAYGGRSDYNSAFQQAFDILLKQQTLDKTKGLGDTTNLILFLTNGQNLFDDFKAMKSIVSKYQQKLFPKAIIQVFAIRAIFHHSFNELLSLVDQNNGKTKGFNGITNVTAKSWGSVYPTPVGPPGTFTSMPQDDQYTFTDLVSSHASLLDTGQSKTHNDFLFQPVVLDKTGPMLQLISEVTNKIVMTSNLSVVSLLSDAASFRLGSNSYSFVLEKGSGHVVIHPKLATYLSDKRSEHKLVHLELLEPDLTTSQLSALFQSTSSVNSFSTKVSQGMSAILSQKEANKKDAIVHHVTLQKSNFILVVVVFLSDMRTRLPVKNVATSKKLVYHRYDKIPGSNLECVLNSSLVLQDRATIKFSPRLFKDPMQYIYKEETKTDVQNIQNFINSPNSVSPPSTIISDNLHIDNLLSDLAVLQSTELIDIWSWSKNTAKSRFFATPSGLLLVKPGRMFPNLFDPSTTSWYKQALESEKLIISKSTFPGKDVNTIFSLPIFDSKRSLFGVTGAVVSNPVLDALLKNSINLCVNTTYSCHFLDKYGYMMGPSSNHNMDSHLTHVYPWLVNYLLKNNILLPESCFDPLHIREHHFYTLDTPGIVDVTSSDDCRKFVLHPVRHTNIYLLVLKQRHPTIGCTNENRNPSEGCSLLLIPPHPAPLVRQLSETSDQVFNDSIQYPGPVGPKPPILKPTLKPKTSVYTGQCSSPGPGPVKCSPPSSCSPIADTCTKILYLRSAAINLKFCPVSDGIPSNSITPPPRPAGPMHSKCTDSCGELSSVACQQRQQECELLDSLTVPMCVRKVTTTTSTTTTTTTSTTRITSSLSGFKTTTSNNIKHGSDSNKAGAIVGGIIAAVVVAVLVFLGVKYIYPKLTHSHTKISSTPKDSTLNGDRGVDTGNPQLPPETAFETPAALNGFVNPSTTTAPTTTTLFQT